MIRLLFALLIALPLASLAEAAPCGPRAGVRARAAVRIARAQARLAARVARAQQAVVVAPPGAAVQVQPVVPAPVP
jgi:hypothetical protein